MANTKSTQHELDLTSSLNLNKFKADIKPYEGFNERNAPYYGGCLSPLYMKDDGIQSDGVQFYNGDKYYIQNGTLYKNDEVAKVVPGNGSFTVTKAPETIMGVQILEYASDRCWVGTNENNGTTYLYIQAGNSSVSLTLDANEHYVQSRLFQSETVQVGVLETTTRFMMYSNLVSNKTEFYKSSFGEVYNYNRIDISSDGQTIMINGAIYAFNSSTNRYSAVTVRTTLSGVSCTQSNGLINGNGHSGTFSEFIKNTTWGNFLLFVPVNANVFSTTDWNGIVVETGNHNSEYGKNTRSIRYYRGGLTLSLESGSLYADLTNISEYTHFFTFNLDAPFVAQPKISMASFFPFAITGGEDLGIDESVSRLNAIAYVASYCDNKLGMPIINIAQARGWPQRPGTYPSYYITENWASTSFSGEMCPVPAGGLMYEDSATHFRVLSTNTGIIQGISYSDESNMIGSLLTNWGSIDNSKGVYIYSVDSNTDKIVYYDSDERCWFVITHNKNTKSTGFSIIGNYLIFNTDAHLNAVKLSNLELVHWASDWNNRLHCNIHNTVIDYYLFSDDDDIADMETTSTYSSGQNVNFLYDVPSSATFAPIVTNSVVNVDNTPRAIAAGTSYNGVDGLVEFYKDYKYLYSITSDAWLPNTYNPMIVDSNVTYPSTVRYNIPLFFDVINSPYDLTVVRFGTTGFLVMYYDTKIRYQYTADSIVNFDIMFIIQGQAYGVARNRIYSVSYSNNTIQAVQPITTIEGLEYIGATIYNAYFYSPTARSIYSFGADNNLVVFSQADTFAEITGASYIPATGSILIGVNETKGDVNTGCLYVLNERFGIYRINDIKGFISGSRMNDTSIVCLCSDNHAYRLAYEDLDGEESDYVMKNIILDTSFYGAGSNVVSVNDCWYIRITDTEHHSGEVKLAVSTLTDIGRSTETRTFKVKESDWDELTDTVYIRFQPKLQRAVGVSLHIESPFKIGYIGVGATPETLQLNKGTI